MAESRADVVTGDELVVRCVEGDRDALVQLLEFVGPSVRGSLRIDDMWRSSLDADDVMQTTYMEVFLRVDRLEVHSVAGFRGWMRTVAENNLRDAIKALQRAKRPDPRQRLAETQHGDSTVGLLDAIGCISHTASRDAVAREAETMLREALERLPESYRLVVTLLDLNGEAIDDIANRLGRSVGAIYMLRARAHDRLREILGPRSRMLGSHI
jgi:RNA polymerase sigma-70 factor (ECF subfamily)